MQTDDEPGRFDCVQWTREVRDEMYEETKHMSTGQRLDRLRSRRPTHPVLAKMWDNAKPLPSSRWSGHGTHRVDGREETQSGV